MLITLMALALAGSNGPDDVIATAPATPAPPIAAATDVETTAAPSTTIQSATDHSLTTDEQIARWVAARTPG